MNLINAMYEENQERRMRMIELSKYMQFAVFVLESVARDILCSGSYARFGFAFLSSFLEFHYQEQIKTSLFACTGSSENETFKTNLRY